MLDRDLHQRLVNTLMHVPLTTSADGRDILLEGIPPNIINGLYRNSQREIDIHKIIDQLDNLGRFQETGIRPLIIFLENALKKVTGTKVGTDLKKIIQDIEKVDLQDDIRTQENLNDTPIQEKLEVLVYGGSEERLSYDFFERAVIVPRSIARLQIPRFFGNQRNSNCAYGTGWLITPDILVTNYHVIEARDSERKERSATESEIYKQVQYTQVWFDYFYEGGPRVECSCQELICWGKELDYALIRLDCTQLGEMRPALQLAQPQQLYAEDRLNIVQYARSSPLKFAVRNNFFVRDDPSQHHIYYVTDTEDGSSGAPVCNDDWQVVAMHCKTYQVRPETRKGETIQYHNVGIEIYAIFNQLQSAIQQEIMKAQEWI